MAMAVMSTSSVVLVLLMYHAPLSFCRDRMVSTSASRVTLPAGV